MHARSDLSFNAFSGVVPPSLFHGAATAVILNDNQFVSPLPDFTGSSIVILVITNNRFDEPFPASLGALTTLETLRMENNSFSGELVLAPALLVQLALIPNGNTAVLQVGGNKLNGMAVSPELCPVVEFPANGFNSIILPMPNLWELNYTCDTVNDLLTICGGDTNGAFALQHACSAAAALPAAVASLASSQAALASSQAALASSQAALASSQASSQAALASSQAALATAQASVTTLQAAAVVDAATIAALRAAAPVVASGVLHAATTATGATLLALAATAVWVL